MSVITEVKDLVEVHRYTRGLIGPSTEPDQVVRPGGRDPDGLTAGMLGADDHATLRRRA